jgi:hypothetical protein
MSECTMIASRPMSRREAASYLGVTPQTLTIWAIHGKGPRYSRSGPTRGRCWYREEDLIRWLESRTVEPAK